MKSNKSSFEVLHRRDDGLKKNTENTFPEPFDGSQWRISGCVVEEEGLKKDNHHLELQ